jgi:hypothetical protein
MKKVTDMVTNESTPVEPAPIVLETAKTGIESCDLYLWLIECLSKENTASSDTNNYQKLYNDFLTSRKDIPVNQLELTCQSLTDNILINGETLEWSTCKLAIPISEIPTNDSVTTTSTGIQFDAIQAQ